MENPQLCCDPWSGNIFALEHARGVVMCGYATQIMLVLGMMFSYSWLCHKFALVLGLVVNLRPSLARQSIVILAWFSQIN